MKYQIATAVLPLLTAAPFAQADFITLDYLGHGRGSFQSVQVESAYNWDEIAYGESYYLDCSEQLWAQAGQDTTISHCVQVYTGIPDGSSIFEVVDIADAPGSPPWPGMMGELKATLLEDLFAEWVDPLTGGVYDSAKDEATATAFQILTWEITHENFSATSVDDMAQQIDLDRGAIKWSSTGGEVSDIVTDMVALLQDGSWSSAPIVGLTSESVQDQALYVPGPGVLLAMGLGGVVGSRRRRN